jgi:hypothetical protein
MASHGVSNPLAFLAESIRLNFPSSRNIGLRKKKTGKVPQ